MDAFLRRSAPAISLVAVLVVGACTTPTVAPSFGSPMPPSSGVPTSVGSASPSPSPAAAFPVTVTDDENTGVTIEARPERIVSLQPASTEIVFALDAGERVVGKVEDIFDSPPEAKDVPVVATYQGVDVEKVIGLEPDLVIAGGNGGNPPEDIAQLRSLGVPVLVVYPETVDAVLDNIRLIGTATGQSVEANDLVADLDAKIDEVALATRDLATPRTFYEIDATTDIYGPADGSFLAGMIELAGGDPITTGSTDFVPIPLEVLITADPEVIVLGDAAYGVSADQVADRPGWEVMTAVREGAIRPAYDVIITRPGPRIAEGLVDLAKAIHPDLAAPAG
jgi:iron complex transport system substrate-binding protein